LTVIVGLMDFIAFLGFIILLIQLERMTRDMALRTSAKRLGLALWLVLPAGLVLSFVPVPTVAETGFVSADPFAVIVISVLLVPVYAIAVILVLSLIDLVGFSHWAKRHERFLRERPGRIADKKSAMNKEAQWLPGGGHDPGAQDQSVPGSRPSPGITGTRDEPGDIPLQ